MKKFVAFCFLIISAFILSSCQLPNSNQSETFENPLGEVESPPASVVQPIPSANQPVEINFSHEGETINWDSRTEKYTEDWILLWGKPGNPAVTTKLIFNAGSQCNLGQGYQLCRKDKLNNGERVRVEGQGNETEVIVVKLEKI